MTKINGNTAETDPRTKRLRWRGIAGTIVVLAIVVGLALIYFFGLPNFENETPWVAYYEGSVDIPEKTPIYYRNTIVGRVDDVASDHEYLQIAVRRFHRIDHVDVMTIAPNTQATLDDATVVTFKEGAVTLALDPVTITVARVPVDPDWFISYADTRKTAWLNDTLLGDVKRRRKDSSIALYPGDELRLGRTSVEWNAPGLYTRVRGTINADEVAELSNSTRSLRAGSYLSRNSTFSLTAPVLKLHSSADTVALFPHRSSQAIDTTRMELAAHDDIDIAEAINSASKYAFDKRYTYAPPRNRVERIVADANLFIPRVSDRLDGTFGVLERDIDTLVGNTNDEVDKLSATVRNETLPAITNEVTILQQRLSRGVGALEHQVALLRANLDRPINSADVFIRNADVAVNGIDVSLNQALDEIMTTVRNLNMTVAKLKRTIP